MPPDNIRVCFWTFQNNCWECIRMPQITSKDLKTPAECQKTPQNPQEPFRTAQNEQVRFVKSQNITGHQRMPQNLQEFFRTAQNSWERLRIHQNTSWTSRNISEPSWAFTNCPKHILLRMPQKHSGMFQNNSETMKTLQNTSEHQRIAWNTCETFQNHFKPMRMPQKTSKNPHNVRERLTFFRVT